MTDLQTWCAERTAIAKAASRGPWTVDRDENPFDGGHGYCHVDGWTDYGEDYMDLKLEDAQHIAGMDPTTVRLVMAVVSAGDMVSHYWHVAPASPETGDAFDASLEMLKRDLAALRAHVGREGGDDDTT